MAVLTRPVPQQALENVAEANTKLIQAAKELTDIAAQARDKDPDAAEAIVAQIRRIIESANTINVAIRSTSYVSG